MLDLIILAVVAVGLIQGFRRGALLELAKFIGLFLAVVLSVQLYDTVGLLIAGSLDISESVAPAAGFVLVFGVVMLVVMVVARLIHKFIGAVELNAPDRLAGGLVGGVKMALVLSIALLMLGHINVPGEDARESSALYPPLMDLAPSTWSVVATALPVADRLPYPRFQPTPAPADTTSADAVTAPAELTAGPG